MGTLATGTFEIKRWEETPYAEGDGGPKLSRASMVNAFRGEIEGQSALEYLLVYRDDGGASYVGMERVVGRVGDRSGSFVLQVDGTFAGETAKGTWRVVPGAGTGELRGLRGEGAFVAHHGPAAIEWAGRVWEPTPMRQAAMVLDYDVE